MSLKKIGFVGLGVMGRSMASNLMKAGFDLTVYNRTKASADGLIAQGAHWAASPAEAARACDAVITIVGYPRDVGAREGKLSIMAGGDERAFEAALPLFKAMGKEMKLQGKCGSGQHTKMANQIAIASNMMGVCEALSYAKHAGLDPQQVLASISGGAAGSFSLSNLAPRMLAGNFAPGFYVKHFIKDMGIALESAREMRIELPGLELANKLYQKLAAEGCENDGTQALFKLYDR